MAFRFRLVPLAIAAAVGLLGVKLGDLWLAVDTAPVATARAQPMPEKPAPTAAATSKPALQSSEKSQILDPLSMSSSEIDLLQKLSERRAELDRRAAEVSQREVVLQAAEKRIDEKIAKLASLEKDIGGIVDKQNQEDDARIKSLVKIYESMKAPEAARIFEQLDMPVLLGVLEHMKELKASAILANMDPTKAKTVTLALAERRDAHAKAEPTTQVAQKPAAKP